MTLPNERPGHGSRINAIVLLMVLLVTNLLLAVPKLSYPDNPIFDEPFFVETARALLANGEFRYLNQYTGHPPHGTILNAFSISLFGDNPLGWRLVPLLAHLGNLVLIFILGLLVWDSVAIGLLGAVLFSIDGICFAQASTLLFNAQMVFCLLFSLVLCLVSVRAQGARSGLLAALSGVFLGCAAGFRWPAVFFFPVVLGALFFNSRGSSTQLRDRIVKMSVMIAGVAFGYLAPMTLLGFWGAWNSFSLVVFHRDTFIAHYNLVCNHRYHSQWWSWPLLLRPVWYFFEPPNMFQAVPSIRGVVALGNPLLFALVPVAIVAHIFQWAKGKQRQSIILMVAALSMWLPWGTVGSNTYIHYIYPTLPFTFLLIADSLYSLWRRFPTWGRASVMVTLAWSVYLFAIFYPLYTAQLIPETQWQSLMWLKSWI